MTETELSVAIHNAIKNHTGHTINLAVDIMRILKSKDLFIHQGTIHDIVEIDYIDEDGDGIEEYTVYVEPVEE